MITINFDCFHLFELFCFSATNKVAASLIHKCRPFLGHLNLRGCYNLSSVSLKLTGKLCYLLKYSIISTSLLSALYFFVPLTYRVRGLSCKLRILVFFPLIYVRARAINQREKHEDP